MMLTVTRKIAQERQCVGPADGESCGKPIGFRGRNADRCESCAAERNRRTCKARRQRLSAYLKEQRRLRYLAVRDGAGPYRHPAFMPSNNSPAGPARVYECKTCYDTPDMRDPTRSDADRRPVGIVSPDGQWLCRDCKKPYEERTLTPFRATISSSAGMCLRSL